MRRTEDELLQSLKAVHAFIANHPDQLAEVAATGSYRDLGDILTRLDGHAVAQTSTSLSARASTKRKKALRDELETHHMRPIARVADVIGLVHDDVGVIRMPTTSLSNGQLVAYAGGMGVAASKFRDQFVRAGLRPDFVEQMNAAIERLNCELTKRRSQTAHGEASTQSVVLEIRAGRKLVRALDAFVLLAAANDADLIAEWKLVKRVARPRPTRYALVHGGRALPALPASSEAAPIMATARIATEEKLPAPLPRWSLRRLLPPSFR